MAARKKPKSLRMIWLRHYLNVDCPSTFMNATESARRSGYKCKNDSGYARIGSANLRIMRPKINKWLDRHELSEAALKTKLLSLLNAKKTKFFAHQGTVLDEREQDALEIQIKALEMALKIRGSYAPEKKEVSGPGGGPIRRFDTYIKTDATAKEAADLYLRMIKGK